MAASRLSRPRTLRKVSCCPAKEASGRSSAVAEERTATAISPPAFIFCQAPSTSCCERSRERRGENPRADAARRCRASVLDVVDVELAQRVRDALVEPALREEVAIRLRRGGEAIAARARSRRARLRIISPIEAFLPPTISHVAHAELVERQDVRRSSCSSGAPHGSRTRYALLVSEARASGTLAEPCRMARVNRAAVNRRTVFFVSDQTGVTAETMGHSLLTQFDGLEFRPVTLPFISTLDKAARGGAEDQPHRAEQEGVRPIVFSTLVQDELRAHRQAGQRAVPGFLRRISRARWRASSPCARRTPADARTAWRI